MFTELWLVKLCAWYLRNILTALLYMCKPINANAFKLVCMKAWAANEFGEGCMCRNVTCCTQIQDPDVQQKKK